VRFVPAPDQGSTSSPAIVFDGARLMREEVDHLYSECQKAVNRSLAWSD
jgi:hypothetical protein